MMMISSLIWVIIVRIDMLIRHVCKYRYVTYHVQEWLVKLRFKFVTLINVYQMLRIIGYQYLHRLLEISK